MKWRKAVVAAVLLAVPVWVWAQQMGTDGRQIPGQNASSANPPQPIVMGGVDRSDTSFKAFSFSGDNLLTTEANPITSAYRTGTLINNQLTASGAAMADSSTAIPSYDLKRMALTFYGIFDSLSTVVRVAVQVRGHLTQNTDSSSTFPWYPFTNSTATAGLVKSDSVGHGLAPTQVPLTAVQATSANSSNGGILPGEFVVVFNYSRDDTTAAGNGKPFSAPKGIYKPLNSIYHEWWWAPYTSVRVRVLNGVRSRFRIRVDYAGTAL